MHKKFLIRSNLLKISRTINANKNLIKFTSRYLSSQNSPKGKVAILLAGSGVYDGRRNVLEESARIARGNVKDISELNIENFDALFIPGGFGAAKNFCDFAFKGEKFTVKKEIEEVLVKFHKSQKPIGSCCISPIILAKVFGWSNKGPGIKMTLGNKGESWPFADSISVSESLGNNHQLCDVNEVAVDKENKICTTPAYMKGDANPGSVFNGIEKMVGETLKLI